MSTGAGPTRQPAESSAKTQRSKFIAFLSSLVSGPRALALTAVALIGIVFGIVLLVSAVTVSSPGPAVDCGAVVAPVEDFVGARAQCGSALSDQAIHASAFCLGGVGFLLYPLVNARNSRALLLIAIACTAASLLGLRDGVKPALAIVPALYCLAMAVLVGRRGLRREDQ